MSDKETDQGKDEGFLGRWARRKAESLKEKPLPTPPLVKGGRLTSTSINDEDEPEKLLDSASAEEFSAASVIAENKDAIIPLDKGGPRGVLDCDADQASSQEHNISTQELTDADMPPIESLTEKSDFTPFMSPKVSEELRKLALRKLFQGTVFKHRDGLDDYDDDFTTFAKLGDTVTTDMKHMAAVEARRALEKAQQQSDSATGETIAMTTSSISSPREAALAEWQDFQPEPTGQVEYQSTGKVLIIGTEEALAIATSMEKPLHPYVLLTEASDQASGKSFISFRGERSLRLEGWLGSFSAQLSDNMNNTETLNADLVLDLSPEPLLQQPIKPPGYFHSSPEQLDNTLKDLADMQGTFAKPRYFAYDANVCAHSSSGLNGCTRCIDACPTEAIISIGKKIQVETHLCQGGGTCATVCPTGAIRYNYPAPAHHVDQLRRMLKAWRDAGGDRVSLLLHGSESDIDLEQLPQHILPFELEELASGGPEFWSAALSFGAGEVLLLDDDKVPAISRKSLRHQLSVLSTQLNGLGYPDNAVRLIPALPEAQQDWPDILAQQEGNCMPTFPPATQGGSNNKRQQWLFAMDHLYKHAEQPEDQIPLPNGAPFGRLKVDQDKCTLCMACSTICPAKALGGGTDSPQLRLHPANCVQCGLCVTGCPEQAITLEPLFIANRELRQRPQTLHEEQPFLCISCGKPFASRSIIETMLSKLQGHHMFQNERAKQRLKMCEDCRVVDIVQDDEAMGKPDFKGVIGKG